MKIKHRRFLAAALVCLMLLLAFAGCGSKVSLTGDPMTYTSADGTVSIDLPAASEETWVANEDALSNTLDVTHEGGTINVQVQCVSKLAAKDVARDVAAWEDYSLTNVFTEFASRAGDLKDEASISVPAFAKDSDSYLYTYSDGGDITGYISFFESETCFYTCLITATQETFDANNAVIAEMIQSIQEQGCW